MYLRYLIIFNLINLLVKIINGSRLPENFTIFNKNTNTIIKNEKDCEHNIVGSIRQQRNYTVLPIPTDNYTITDDTEIGDNNNNSTIMSYREALVKTIYDFSSGVKQFGRNLIEYIGDFATDVNILLSNAVDKLKTIIAELGNRILDDDNSPIRSLLVSIKDQLIEIENLFKEFILLSENEFKKITEHVNNTLITFSQDMEMWSDEVKFKLKNVKNEKTYIRGCKLVDAFINDSMKEMKSCCNIAIKPWISFCKSLKDIFGDILILTIDAVDKIDRCMVDNRGTDGFVLCIKQIYTRLIELMDEAKELKNRFIDNMPIKIMFSSCCISVSTVSVEIKKSQFEKKLESDYYFTHKN